MNIKVSFFFTALFSILLCCSCSSKQDPIDDLEDLAFELSENSENYTQSDWEEVSVKYAEIEESLQQYDYTDEELKNIGKLKAKCFASMARSSAKLMKSQFHNIQMQLEGASEEMGDAFKEMEAIFEEEFKE